MSKILQKKKNRGSKEAVSSMCTVALFTVQSAYRDFIVDFTHTRTRARTHTHAQNKYIFHLIYEGESNENIRYEDVTKSKGNF